MQTIKNKAKGFWTILIGMLFMTAYADGEQNPPADPPATPPANPTPTPPADPTPQGTVNFEELIAKARKEEKDKLYPEIEKLKGKNNDLLLVVAERDKRIKELEDEALKAAQDFEKKLKEAGKADNGTASAEASATISKLELAIEALKGEHQREIERLQLDIYKQQKFAEVGADNFLPELVTGNTKEEIDASIEASKTRLAGIRQSVMNGAQLPLANPNSNTVTMKLEKSAEEIQRMTPQEFAAYRKDLAQAGVLK